MKVHISFCGWSHAPIGDEIMCPYGYRTYLCVAENGIVVKQHIAVVDKNDAAIEDGEYELNDEDWSLDNPKWEQMAEENCEKIEVA